MEEVVVEAEIVIATAVRHLQHLPLPPPLLLHQQPYLLLPLVQTPDRITIDMVVEMIGMMIGIVEVEVLPTTERKHRHRIVMVKEIGRGRGREKGKEV